MRYHLLLLGVIAVATAACGASPCKKLCRKLAECQGIDPDKQSTCPFDDQCSTPLQRCQADCALGASCDALTGKSVEGALAIAKCQADCAELDGRTTPPRFDGPTKPRSDGGVDSTIKPDTSQQDRGTPEQDRGTSWPDFGDDCSCDNRECGDDGCGNSCGSCSPPEVCNYNTRKCIESCYGDCSGKQCGDDGCGNSCGSCSSTSEQCVAGICVNNAFGMACTLSAQDCEGGLACIGIMTGTSTPTEGFCSKPCSTPGDVCLGAPTGTLANCILQGSGTSPYFCAFVCKTNGQSYSCPTGLTCSVEEISPGSGLHVCSSWG